MATVQCPIEIPASHDHELLESKRHVPYVRCDQVGSHLYFKTDAAREWLAAHLVNDGRRAIENPSASRETRQDDSPEKSVRSSGPEIGRCGNCNKLVTAGISPCPFCGEPLDWSEDTDVFKQLGM